MMMRNIINKKTLAFCTLSLSMIFTQAFAENIKQKSVMQKSILKQPYTEMVYATGADGADITGNISGKNSESTFWEKPEYNERVSVHLSPYAISRYEVTRGFYKAVMSGEKIIDGDAVYELDAEPSRCYKTSKGKIKSGEKEEFLPVENITWYDAVYFCNTLSRKTGKTPAYTISDIRVFYDTGHIKYAVVRFNPDSDGYRLPTYAEWEFAARGGNPSSKEWKYPFAGSEDIDSVAWYNKDTDVPWNTDGHASHQVGLKKANALGLYDMTGNVSEWGWDISETKGKELYDPRGFHNDDARRRFGGDWTRPFPKEEISYLRISYPDKSTVYYGSRDTGFRLVCSVIKKDAKASASQKINENSPLVKDETLSKNWKAGDVANESILGLKNTREIFATDMDYLTIAGDIDLETYPPEQLYRTAFPKGRRVKLTPYIIGAYEVTQELYKSVIEGRTVNVRGTEYEFTYMYEPSKTHGLEDIDLIAANDINYFDVVYFCNCLSEITGLPPAYEITINEMEVIPFWNDKSSVFRCHIADADVFLIPDSTGYRLPSVCEWEAASRGGNPDSKNWNNLYGIKDSALRNEQDLVKDSALDDIAWYRYNLKDKESLNIHQTGLLLPNALGLYDVCGNVAEFCSSHAEYFTQRFYGVDNSFIGNAVEIDPFFKKHEGKYAIKGGSWSSKAWECSLLAQDSAYPGNSVDFYGLRLCRYVMPPSEFAKIKASQNKSEVQKNLVDEVKVSDGKSSFYISRDKLTVEFLNSVVKGETVRVYDFEYDLDSDNYNPSDADIKTFCNILSEKSGLKEAYRIGVKAVSKYGDIVSATIIDEENADGYRLAAPGEVETAKSKGLLKSGNTENLGVYLVRKAK